VNAYLCTYRQKKPRPREWRRTCAAAEQDTLLRSFLDCYESSYYDWGDDPSFFAAQHLLGDVRKPSWGVCRRDVRKRLKEGDLVVFFCGCQHEGGWHYHFVGFGTVAALVSRIVLWTDPACAAYRSFYNVLARLEGNTLVQQETIYDYHDDWLRRADAPYV